jgi:glutamine amidotransferase
MCRHLAYVGPWRSVHDLVVAPPHSLHTQSWAPRRQRHGTVNVDGFGAGWYVESRPEPVRYRRAQPIWTDASFASLAPTVGSTCLLAAVRSATPGTTPDEAAAAPYTHGRWLFSPNGALEDWSTARKVLAAEAADVADARTGVDSALLFGLAVARWQGGEGLRAGLAGAVRDVLGCGGGRLTVLACHGNALAGVVVGEPMWLRDDTRSGGGVTVASEPHDDDPAWRELADRTLVEATPAGATETLLDL